MDALNRTLPIGHPQAKPAQPLANPFAQGIQPAFGKTQPLGDDFNAHNIAKFDPNGNLSPAHNGKFSLFA